MFEEFSMLYLEDITVWNDSTYNKEVILGVYIWMKQTKKKWKWSSILGNNYIGNKCVIRTSAVVKQVRAATKLNLKKHKKTGTSCTQGTIV